MIIRVKHVFVLVFVCLDFRQLLLHFIGGNSSMSEKLWIKMNEKMLKGKTEFLSLFLVKIQKFMVGRLRGSVSSICLVID